jgi:parallel beta-helix repeat protein
MTNVNGGRFCDQCGAANRSTSKFCFQCGNPLPATSPVSPNVTTVLPAIAHATGLLEPTALLNGRYRIVRKIGQGGFSAVYLVEDLVFNAAPRVIKEMSLHATGSQPLDPQESQQAIASFQQEAMLLAGLTHPNLPRIYDHFEQQQRWYMVMDYINGQTLEERLEQAQGGKLTLKQVLPLARHLCTVLAYLHSQTPPIIFRDLKPANIMITGEEHVYLIDFGIARLFKPGQSKDTVALGSPGYAAPEQYGRAQSTMLSDIYSLGATMHHLLSGRDPAETPFQFAPLTQLESEPGGATISALIQRMIQIAPEQRPQTIQEVKEGLQEDQPGTSPLTMTTQNHQTVGSGINPGGSVVVVAPSGGTYTNISEAVRQVPEKTRILIKPGIYLESVVIEKQVELVGDGPREQIVLMGQQDSCLRMAGNVLALVQGLTIQGHAPKKAAVDIGQGQMVMSECDITSHSGACIHIHTQDARPIVQRCVIHDGRQEGILISEQGAGSIENCDIRANVYPGIVVKTGGTPFVRNCKIHDGKGSGIFVLEEGAGTFEDCEVFSNASDGIAITTKGAPTIRRCKINHGQQSGVFVLKQGIGTFEDCDIFSNANAGIYIKNGGAPTVRRCKIHNGRQSGVFVQEQGYGTFEQCDIYANAYPGISVQSKGAPVVRHCTIHHGKENGIHVSEQGSGTFEHCDIFANTYPDVVVKTGGMPIVRFCAIHDGRQSGVYVYELGVGSFEDCDIFANAADGIAVQSGGSPLVRRCKIHDGRGNGISVYDQGAGSFEDCDIFANALPGINVKTRGVPMVRRCKVHDNRGNGISVLDLGAGTFEDCDIYANVYPGVSVKTRGAPILIRCKIHNGKDVGIYVFDYGAGTFESCETFFNWRGGLYIGRMGYPTLRQCRFQDGKTQAP